jgi:threonine/homoserine/homoserine lactone efflux protein
LRAQRRCTHETQKTSANVLASCLIIFVGAAIPGPTVVVALNSGDRYTICHEMFGFAGAVTADPLPMVLIGLGSATLLPSSR